MNTRLCTLPCLLIAATICLAGQSVTHDRNIVMQLLSELRSMHPANHLAPAAEVGVRFPLSGNSL